VLTGQYLYNVLKRICYDSIANYFTHALMYRCVCTCLFNYLLRDHSICCCRISSEVTKLNWIGSLKRHWHMTLSVWVLTFATTGWALILTHHPFFRLTIFHLHRLLVAH